jgi:hypothetical protein
MLMLAKSAAFDANEKSVANTIFPNITHLLLIRFSTAGATLDFSEPGLNKCKVPFSHKLDCKKRIPQAHTGKRSKELTRLVRPYLLLTKGSNDSGLLPPFSG